MDSEIVIKENCGHRVSKCQVFNFLPTPHAFSIEIYKDNHLLDSAETTVILNYIIENYYENKFIKYYVVLLASGATAGAAAALAEVSVTAGVSAAKVAAITGIIVEIYNTIKEYLRR